jgi:EAL and modified HD-GYP domain-containing signal transduction protein
MSPLMILAATRGKMLELIGQDPSGAPQDVGDGFHGGHHVAGRCALRHEHGNRAAPDHREYRDPRSAAAPHRFLRHRRCAWSSAPSSAPDQVQMQRLLDELQLSADDFFEAEKQAFEWGNSISSNNIGQQASMQMSPPPGLHR